MSYSGYVKAHIRKDEAMIEKKAEMLASRQVAPSVEDRIRSLENLVHEIFCSKVDTREFPPHCPRCEDQELFKCEGRQTESATTNAWVSTWKCPKCGYIMNTYKRIDPKSIKWMDPDTFAIIDKPRTSSRHWAKQDK